MRKSVVASVSGAWVDGQRACYMALRHKGWVVRPSLIASEFWVAIKAEREESVSAKTFRELLDLASQKDNAVLAKERKEKAEEAH